MGYMIINLIKADSNTGHINHSNQAGGGIANETNKKPKWATG